MPDSHRSFRVYRFPMLLLVGLVGAGLIFMVSRREPVSLTAVALADDGRRLPVECRLDGNSDDGRFQLWLITIENTVYRIVAAQARARDESGFTVHSDVATTRVASPARDVNLHVRVSGGRFVLPPKCSEGARVEHVNQGRELVITVDEITFGGEEVVKVKVMPRN